MRKVNVKPITFEDSSYIYVLFGLAQTLKDAVTAVLTGKLDESMRPSSLKKSLFLRSSRN